MHLNLKSCKATKESAPEPATCSPPHHHRQGPEPTSRPLTSGIDHMIISMSTQWHMCMPLQGPRINA
eukprot:6306611-Amphidinium_carterae.2